jgi:PAS domain S-box-containing protein
MTSRIFKSSVIIFLLVLISYAVFASTYNSDTIYFKGNNDYPPYQLINTAGQPDGFSVELLHAIARTMGLNIKVELGDWNTVRNELEQAKIDGLAGMSPSPERSKIVNFSTTYVFLTHSLFVRKGSEIESLNNISEKQVIVVKGDIMHDYLISNRLTKYIIPVKNYQTALRLLSAGEYDCALINKLQGQFAINEFNLTNLRPVGSAIQPREMAFGISKNRPELISQFNDGLQILKSTGEYDQLYEKWFGVYEQTDIKAKVLTIIAWILIPFGIILTSIIFWSWSLRKQVAAKTYELQAELNERRKAENELIKEKSLLNSMINSIPDLIFYKDKDNKYLGCNNAFLKFSNISGDIKGKTDFELFTFDKAQHYSETDGRLMLENKHVRVESWEQNAIGQKFLLDTLKVPFTDDEGNVLGIVGICHDITERYKTEIDLTLAKEKAEESDRLKSSFLANMSHEIRTPMNAIIGFSDLLVDSDTDINEREELVSHINNNCNTLLHLIDDIIDLAKIEANELSVTLRDTNVNAIIQELYDTYSETRKRINKSHILLTLQEDLPRESILIKTDPFRLKQILTNLIDNAFKFTEIGTIEFGYKFDKNENYIEFYVKDTGIGIPKSKFDEIFQRFSKLETDKTRLYRGTGLGLTITKNLVERLGGTIWLDSESNKGSIFYFNLPITSSIENYHQITNNLETASTDKWEGKTILIAEDEESNYKYLEMVLKNKGLNLLRAENGFEAIEICKGKIKIDLILMDIKMPGMNGLEATTQIKKIKPEIPIIIQTAHAMHNDEKISHEAGCDDYISKPIKKERLISLIDRWIHRTL